MKWYYPLLIIPTIIYKAVTDFRNHLFNIGYKKSFTFEVATIGVGNLSVGGTGKTPAVDLLIVLMKPEYTISTLSRGYGRSTAGFRLASDDDTAASLGDEPMQLYKKWSAEVAVAVGEERAVAIPFILAHRPEVDLIILDDAFQHRYVKPHLQILLTRYNRLFYEDQLLPLGRLRESRKGAARADMVVVTKCPETLSEQERQQISAQIAKYTKAGTPLFFAFEKYAPLQSVFKSVPEKASDSLLLVTGIASADSLKAYVQKLGNLDAHFQYDDHHVYTKKDMEKIKQWCEAHPQGMVITTEKDKVKIAEFGTEASYAQLPIYFLPIKMSLDEAAFKKIVKEKLKSALN